MVQVMAMHPWKGVNIELERRNGVDATDGRNFQATRDQEVTRQRKFKRIIKIKLVKKFWENDERNINKKLFYSH